MNSTRICPPPAPLPLPPPHLPLLHPHQRRSSRKRTRMNSTRICPPPAPLPLPPPHLPLLHPHLPLAGISSSWSSYPPLRPIHRNIRMNSIRICLSFVRHLQHL